MIGYQVNREGIPLLTYKNTFFSEPHYSRRSFLKDQPTLCNLKGKKISFRPILSMSHVFPETLCGRLFLKLTFALCHVQAPFHHCQSCGIETGNEEDGPSVFASYDFGQVLLLLASRTAITKSHKLLTQNSVLEARSSKIEVSEDCFLLRAQRENLSHAVLAGCQQSLSFLGLWQHNLNLCLHSHTVVLLGLCVFTGSSYKDTDHWNQGQF